MAGLLQKEMLGYQLDMIYSKATYPALVCGFGAGKSETLIMKALKQMFEIPNAQIAIYEPTVDLIKRIMYPRFEEILSNAGLIYKLNKSEGTLVIPNVGTVIFRSLENPSRIIGYEVHHSLVDELDTLDEEKAEEAWMKIISRNRKRIPNGSKNTVSVMTTPEGFRFTYKRWHKQRLEDLEKRGYSDYELIQGSTYSNIFLPPEYITNLENSYPKQLIQAYLNGQFVNLETGQVYVNFDMELNNTDRMIDKGDTLHIGMDFNVNHMSAVVGVRDGDKLYICEELMDKKDTPDMIRCIKELYDGHNITIYPDASGNSRKTIDAGKSDIALLKEAGFKVNAPLKNPPVKDRIMSTNALFCNMKEERRLFVNTAMCPKLTDALNEQAYDDSGNPRKANNVDHPNDAVSYLATRLFGLNAPRTKIRRMTFM